MVGGIAVTLDLHRSLVSVGKKGTRITMGEALRELKSCLKIARASMTRKKRLENFVENRYPYFFCPFVEPIGCAKRFDVFNIQPRLYISCN